MRNKIKEQEIKWPKDKWPEHLEINVQDYERNWLDSTENGHELRIVRTDGSTIRINMEHFIKRMEEITGEVFIKYE